MEQQVQAGGVTCILTSCNRFDLLERTIESFFLYNTYPITDFIIYEDSGIKVPEYLYELYPFIKWITPKERTGQIVALDTIWAEVKTQYAFTMEDDWEFIENGFIEDSMRVLEQDAPVLQCWLHKKDGVQPIEWRQGYAILKPSGGLWAGTRFSPALKRKADYDLIGSYGKHTTFEKHRPWKAEAAISQLYHKLGFVGAILPKIYIKHIGGDGRHVN